MHLAGMNRETLSVTLSIIDDAASVQALRLFTTAIRNPQDIETVAAQLQNYVGHNNITNVPTEDLYDQGRDRPAKVDWQRVAEYLKGWIEKMRKQIVGDIEYEHTEGSELIYLNALYPDNNLPTLDMWDREDAQTIIEFIIEAWGWQALGEDLLDKLQMHIADSLCDCVINWDYVDAAGSQTAARTIVEALTNATTV